MNAFEFVEELPCSPHGNNQEKYGLLQEFVEALKKSPGKWAKYPLPPANARSAHTRAHQIRSGQLKAFREDAFEAAVRAGELYVRVVIA